MIREFIERLNKKTVKPVKPVRPSTPPIAGYRSMSPESKRKVDEMLYGFKNKGR